MDASRVIRIIRRSLIVVLGVFLLFAALSPYFPPGAAVSEGGGLPDASLDLSRSNTASPIASTTTLQSDEPSGPAKTPKPTKGPVLGTPFGPAQEYVIHRVTRGDSFPLLAERYDTTEEVLRKINSFKPGDILWRGQVIVIAIGQHDPEQTTAMQAIRTQQSTLLSQLADSYLIDPQDLREINELGPSDQIPANRFLIIPLAYDMDPTDVLRQPFGPQGNFIIHRVAEGQSLRAIAQIYHTNAETLTAINALPKDRNLQPGWGVLVVLDAPDPGGLPSFRVVQTEEELTAGEIAGQYGANAEDFDYYNDFTGPDEEIPAGSWVIVPQ